MENAKQRKINILACCVIGMLTSAVVCLSGIAVLTQLTLAQKVGERTVMLLLTADLALSVLAGNLLSMYCNGWKAVQVQVTTILLFLAMLFAIGLSMEGKFSEPLHTMLGIGIGGAISCVLSLKKRSRRGRRKRHPR